MLGELNGGQAARLDFADAGGKFCPVICTTGIYHKVILPVKLLQTPQCHNFNGCQIWFPLAMSDMDAKQFISSHAS